MEAKIIQIPDEIYKQVEEIAKLWDTTPDMVIINAICDYIENVTNN